MIELESVFDVPLRPRTEYALFAGWTPAVTTGDNRFGVVWRGLATSTHEAYAAAEARIRQFRAAHRCNGCRLNNAVFVDMASLREDGLDGASFYCSLECARVVADESQP